MAVWPSKTPGEIVDRGLEWKTELGDKTITSSSFAVTEGTVVKVADGLLGTRTGVRISGGTEGESAVLINTVVLSTGETWQETVYIKVETF